MAHDYRAPQAVRDAARKGLELRRRYGRGGSEAGLEVARRLAMGRPMSLNEVRLLAQFFSRHAKDAPEPPGAGQEPSDAYIAWLLWGGDTGREWAGEVLGGLGTAL
ncbi:hypothetical protein Mterra_03155 [Calidithermus terrae]|uniref:Uncharacterized protein n=1 Tax=Calidithermus terrae TaxID=1408545 RepID=A0A399E9P2_9DEIN|nr:DNA-binding protein [Calidithermus terrae]RIH81447.1 hypothetical protein Mterra_03155 [Calidithermus terrae]